MSSKRIPIDEAKHIATRFGYDQVIILARNTSEHKDWFTSYGKSKEDCRQAAEGLDNIYKWLEKLHPGTTVSFLTEEGRSLEPLK